MADKRLTPPQPERGWGQLFPIYLKHPEMVRNYALKGRSSRSFVEEGHWQKVLDAMESGDYVIIQFGHNDEKIQSPKRYSDAATSFRENLKRFIEQTHGKGAEPILATPIVRRRFNDAGQLEETHGDYPKAVRDVAAETNTPLLEMHDRTGELLIRYGVERSKDLFLWVDPDIFASCPNGKQDDSHLSAIGASRVSEIAAAELRRLNHPLAGYLK